MEEKQLEMMVIDRLVHMASVYIGMDSQSEAVRILEVVETQLIDLLGK